MPLFPVAAGPNRTVTQAQELELAARLLAASLPAPQNGEEPDPRRHLNLLAQSSTVTDELAQEVRAHVTHLARELPQEVLPAPARAQVNWLLDAQAAQKLGLRVRWEKTAGPLHTLYAQALMLAQFDHERGTDFVMRQSPVLLVNLEDRAQEETAMMAMQSPRAMLVIAPTAPEKTRQRFQAHQEDNTGLLIEVPAAVFSALMPNHVLERQVPLYLEPMALGLLAIHSLRRTNLSKKELERHLPALFRALARCS